MLSASFIEDKHFTSDVNVRGEIQSSVAIYRMIRFDISNDNCFIRCFLNPLISPFAPGEVVRRTVQDVK